MPTMTPPVYTYKTIHWHLIRDQGHASQHSCVQCGKQAAEWAYDGTDPDEQIGKADSKTQAAYSLNLTHYVPMCRSCHRYKDAVRRTHCSNGHEFTESNTRMALGSDGNWYQRCRACVTAAQRRCRERKRVTR